MNPKDTPTKPNARIPIEEILQVIRKIKYGSVEVVIHDSRVVQIETREKIRPSSHITDTENESTE